MEKGEERLWKRMSEREARKRDGKRVKKKVFPGFVETQEGQD